MVGLDYFKDTLEDLKSLSIINHHSPCTYLSYALFVALFLCLILQNFGFAYESAMALLDSTSNMPKAISIVLTAIVVLAHCIPGLGYTLKGGVTVNKILTTHSDNQ